MAASDQPWTAIWPLLTTWSLAACSFPEGSPHREPWLSALQKLELDAEHLPERLIALDAYLDRIEEILDNWARDNGVYEES